MLREREKKTYENLFYLEEHKKITKESFLIVSAVEVSSFRSTWLKWVRVIWLKRRTKINSSLDNSNLAFLDLFKYLSSLKVAWTFKYLLSLIFSYLCFFLIYVLICPYYILIRPHYALIPFFFMFLLIFSYMLFFFFMFLTYLWSFQVFIFFKLRIKFQK